MRIKIRTQDVKFTILLPGLLIFNSLTASLASRIINKHICKNTDGSIKPKIDPVTARHLIHELNRIKRKHGRFTLVDVESADGDIVKIVL